MKLINEFCCLNAKCSAYGKKDIGNISVHSRYGKYGVIRMLKCTTCGTYFSERRSTALYNCKLQEDKALEVIYHLSKGRSIRKINRLTGVSRDAISRLAHIDGQCTNSLHDELVRCIRIRTPLFDERRNSGGKREDYLDEKNKREVRFTGIKLYPAIRKKSNKVWESIPSCVCHRLKNP